MSTNSELIAQQLAEAVQVRRIWGGIMYNVLNEGLVGDGVADDTDKLQALINKAIAEGRRTIFFPHTSSGGKYYVTALPNADQVDFVGDNCSFVGGFDGTIGNMGGFAEHLADDLKFKSITSPSGNVERNSLLSFTKQTAYWDDNLPGPYNPTVLGAGWRQAIDKENTTFTTLYIEEIHDLTTPGIGIFSDPNKSPDAVFGITSRIVVNGNSNERSPAGESVSIAGLIASSEPDTSLYGFWSVVEHAATDSTGTARLHGMEINIISKTNFTPAGGSNPGILTDRFAFGVWVNNDFDTGAATAAFAVGDGNAYGLLGIDGKVTRAFIHFPAQVGAVAVEPGNMGRQTLGTNLSDAIISPSSSFFAPKIGFGAVENPWVLKNDGTSKPIIALDDNSASFKILNYCGATIPTLTGGALQVITVALPPGLFANKPTGGIMLAAEDVNIYGSYKFSTSTKDTAEFVVRRMDGTNLPSAPVRLNFTLFQ